MKNLFVLCLFCGLSFTAFGQESFFAFVNKDQGGIASGDIENYKFRVTKMVFDSLVDGQGDFRRQRPTLVMNNGKSYVAWTLPEKAEIGMEEQAYDICASFGPDSLNALAALLTHELVHYYKMHEWNRHFVKENKELSTAQQLKKLEEGLKLEAQADYLGGFLAYSIGFDVYGIMPELLKKVYAEDAYDLPEEIDGYPSLHDRIAMSEKQMDRLYELQIVFETAKYLSLLESNQIADKYYQYILKDFQSRDIYNNAGVNALLSALPLFNNKEMPYALPFELDPDSRLQKKATRDPESDRKKQREIQIQIALDYFDNALMLDEQYAPAFLNKAVSYVLLGDWEEANYWLRRADKVAPNVKVTTDVQILKGVIAAQQEDLEGAKAWWERAKQENNNYLAEINLNVLKSGAEQTISQASPRKFGMVYKKEKIEQLSLDQFLLETEPDRMVHIDDRTICGVYLRPQSVIYAHSVDLGQEFISVQVVNETYPGKSLEGIQIGDTREKLRSMYGHPQRQVQSPAGEYLLYEEGRNLFFQLNAGAKVCGWGVFRNNKK